MAARNPSEKQQMTTLTHANYAIRGWDDGHSGARPAAQRQSVRASNVDLGWEVLYATVTMAFVSRY